MKRKSIIFLLFAVTIAGLTGCGTKLGLNIVRTIPLPDAYAHAAQNTTDTVAEQNTTNTVAEQGRFKTLDEIKKRAVDAGYETEELFGMQMASGVTDGFGIVIDDCHLPVLEFATPEETQTFADMVNAAGYNISVVNGRYMSMISAKYGKAASSEQQTAIESILDAKAQFKNN